MFGKHRSDSHHTGIFGFLAAGLHHGHHSGGNNENNSGDERSNSPQPSAVSTFTQDGDKFYDADSIDDIDRDNDFSAYATEESDQSSGPQADRTTILKLLGEEDDDGLAIHHYQGWLAKDVLLQGKIHITKKYLLFAAPLPPTTLEVLKESPLSKKSARGLTTIGRSSYQRKWFVLHMGSLSWYASAGETYFPLGVLPLRQIVSVGFDRKSPKKFILRSSNGRSYTFKADSSHSAYDWAKAIQKEVFRARNEGSRAAFVRIPLENIIKADVKSNADATWQLTLKTVVSQSLPQHGHPHQQHNQQHNQHHYLHPRQHNSQQHQHGPVIGDYIFAFFGRPNTVDSISKRLATYTGDFSNHSGIQFKTDHHGEEEIRPHHSQFGAIREDILDTTPPMNFQTLNEHDDIVRGPGSLVDPLSPVHSNSSAANSAPDSPKLLSHNSSGTSTPTTRSSKNKNNILPSLNHRLNKLKIDELIPTPSRIMSTLTSENASESESGADTPDVSDNEENADSDFESDEHGEKKYFDDSLLPFLADKSSTCKLTFSNSDTKGSSDETPVEFEHKIVSDPEELDRLNNKFREHFGLEPSVFLETEYIANLRKPGNSVSWQGKLFLSNLFLCFRRRGIFGGAEWRTIIPLHDIIQIRELEDDTTAIEFEVSEPAYGPFKVSFGEKAGRDDCARTLRSLVKRLPKNDPDARTNRDLKAQHSDADVEQRFLEYSLRSARLATYEPTMTAKLRQRIPPLMFDPTSTEFSEAFLKRPMESLKFVMMMIGSRGDVQPYIALSQGLIAEGHKCCIVTHSEFKDWVESFGIEFRELAGDPGKLMEIMIEHGSFSYSFLKDALSNFRQWVDDLMHSAWNAIKNSGADVFIESPSSMIGIHIAEALNIPYFRAFTMPWTRTRTYPQALIQPDQKMGNGYNYFTYVLFERLIWLGISKQCNQWRKKELGLPPSSLDVQRQQDVPFLYCVSPTVLVPPLDQPNWVHTTGYWNVHEETKDRKEPEIDPKLIEFMKTARRNNKKLVYIGFGSIIVTDPELMTQCVIDGTKEADVYCVLGRGWSSREAKSDNDKKQEKKPINEPNIFEVDSISHQWLFPQIDACVHHGGSGTTGASLSAGKPTIIKPFFGDQFFYGRRVSELGVGVNLKKLTKSGLANALHKCVTDGPMIRQAAVLGEQIRHEHGVEGAVLSIYRELSYAKQVTERRRRETAEAAEKTVFDPISLLSPSDSKSLSNSIIMKPKNYMDNVLPTFGKRKQQVGSKEETDDGEIDVSV